MLNIIKNKKFIYIIVVGILTVFILYPHSAIAKFLWFAGSYISPGTENAFTEWFVYTNIFIISLFNGIITYFLYKKIKHFYVTKVGTPKH